MHWTALLWWGCATPVSWENDIHIPVLDDRVTWADVVPDSLYEPGLDGGPAHFVLVDTLDGWDWTAWSQLPDTTLSVRYDGEGVLQNGVPVQAGIPVALSDDELPVVEIDLSEPEGLALTTAQLSGGAIQLEVQHSLQCEVNVLFTFPGVQINGESMEVGLQLPPATEMVAGSESAVVDMTGAEFDFTQVSGFDSNALEVQVLAVSGEVTAPNGIYLVSATDSIVMNLTFQSVEVETLAGYFGQLTEAASADVALLDTVPLPEPSIDLDGTTASLHVTNTIGADLRLFIDTLQFDDNLVEGDLIAGHDIPASCVGERCASAKRMVLGFGKSRFDVPRGAGSLPAQLARGRTHAIESHQHLRILDGSPGRGVSADVLVRVASPLEIGGQRIGAARFVCARGGGRRAQLRRVSALGFQQHLSRGGHRDGGV